ncbi:Fur-regulated basic protein FbpB [Bacillus pumilus]|uniref:Fur-regulated basic protein FbpB n=1 Tax=Bacillus pumilus TaxID=1408 RepID=A0AAD0HK60_BACPU|nr:Fur-regulated basic protein FbpB [Bacillus pumilus]AVM22764.1 Fur-regulated basic protein FbpB [Bacillus pumilus]TYS32317.1 Fur-regulated basic protein FbpB [Bacillus pumilus]TYS41432.1 Fur-regulated basic protein FbpB [Bacillus pumilus]TYS48375.1 Fur-regulated basic protein FbpB [Bacillus pumilus]
MSKKRIKTYQQLIEENKKAIMRDPKMMESIYETIDNKHQKQLAAAGRES